MWTLCELAGSKDSLRMKHSYPELQGDGRLRSRLGSADWITGKVRGLAGEGRSLDGLFWVRREVKDPSPCDRQGSKPQCE